MKKNTFLHVAFLRVCDAWSVFLDMMVCAINVVQHIAWRRVLLSCALLRASFLFLSWKLQVAMLVAYVVLYCCVFADPWKELYSDVKGFFFVQSTVFEYSGAPPSPTEALRRVLTRLMLDVLGTGGSSVVEGIAGKRLRSVDGLDSRYSSSSFIGNRSPTCTPERSVDSGDQVDRFSPKRPPSPWGFFCEFYESPSPDARLKNGHVRFALDPVSHFDNHRDVSSKNTHAESTLVFTLPSDSVLSAIAEEGDSSPRSPNSPVPRSPWEHDSSLLEHP